MIKSKKYPRGNIYLSGGIQFADNLGASWRAECAERLRLVGYFPIDIVELDTAYTAEHGHLYRNFSKDRLLEKKSNVRKHFVHADIELIVHDSDALIVLYDESARLGGGTISEMQTAYTDNLPIFVLSSYEDWFKEVPEWLQALSTKVFTNFDDLHRYFDRLPEGILCRDQYGNHHSGSHYLCFLCGEPFVKNKTHFVSTISPLYCSSCVEIVKETHESHEDRYRFFVEYLQNKVANGDATDEPARIKASVKEKLRSKHAVH
ncbi:hypothetical protein LCGC14_1458430 [marine sediment metagenome]|uniref:Nucleoside 2-deoxyribosyltransferase n=1 Tax=marine sediment metagenome TaxID=412755 RepID=A0A0F9K1X2_9ZZZZ